MIGLAVLDGVAREHRGVGRGIWGRGMGGDELGAGGPRP